MSAACFGPIKHYYHIFADGHGWSMAVDEHLTALTDSGLRDVCSIYIGVVGSPTNRSLVKRHLDNHWGLKYEVVAEAEQGWEQITMDQIDLSEPAKILYCHTKGASNVTALNNEWRRSMTLGCVHGWRRAVDLLDIFDAVGCYWRPDVIGVFPRHFSGTFWWATTEYLSVLPRPVPADNRWQAEMWIGMSKGKGPFHIYDFNRGGVKFHNLMHTRDFTPAPEGYEKFYCICNIMGYKRGRSYVAPATPLLRAVLDQGVNLYRFASSQSDFETYYTIE